MKTAEEIIFGLGYYPSKKGTEMGRLIVKAMEEYADQFKPKKRKSKPRRKLMTPEKFEEMCKIIKRI